MTLSKISRCLLSSALAAAVTMGSAASGYAQASCSSSKDLFLNPFNKDSAHHRPIGTGAQYAGVTHAATRDWLKARGFSVNPGYELWGSHILKASTSDPVRTISGKGDSMRLPAQIRLPAAAANTPKQQSGNNDNQVVIFDSASSAGNELYRWDWNGGNPTAWIRRTADWRGLGHGTASGQRVGNTAAGFSMAFGILRGHEINTPGYKIDHALQLALPGKGLSGQTSCNILLSRNIVLPATARDWFATQPGNNTGNIPYGALLALPPSVNISVLGLSEPGRRLAEAFRDYGAYVVDDGGCAGGAIRADQHIKSQIRNQLHNDISRIYPHMRMVLNSAWRSGQSAVGGGTPLAPNCAFDAGATNQNVSTPQSGSSKTQNQKSTSSGSSSGSSSSTGSSGGKLSWAAVAKAQNYYLEIRAGSGRGAVAFGGMVRPEAGGCPAGKGTCTRAVPSLPSGQSYVWNVRAVVGGKNLSPTPWQPVGSSTTASSSTSGATSGSSSSGSRTAASSPKSSSTSGSSSTGSSGGKLSWAAVAKAQNYYLEIRAGSGRGKVAFGRMVRPEAGGCPAGKGTCTRAVPSLPSGQSYVWNVRAVVGGKNLSPTPWQPVG